MKKTLKKSDRASSPARKANVAPGVPLTLLASALSAQGDGVVVSRMSINPLDLKIIFANDTFLRMTGRTLAELGAGTQCALHADKSDLEKYATWLKSARLGRAFTGEGFLLRKNGTSLYAAWSFNVILNRVGRPAHLVATYRDTTEKRNLQEALVHAQRLDAVGRLAGGVAHDFNNLISVINGYCEMLAAQLTDRPQALHEVTEIHSAGRKAAVLTRQLLAFGRRQTMDTRVIGLNQFVRENTEILSRLLGANGKLELELDPKTGNVRTDPVQFQQVLLNLVLNAKDALRDQGRVIIRTGSREVRPGLNRRATDPVPGRYNVVSVADNGTGIDVEAQKHLFEPFFTTKPEGKGSGLGLAMVYGVVQQSGGFVSVQSELLVGSTFEILLPAVAESAEVMPAAAAAPIPALPVTRGHEVVLVIEEDEVLRKMVAGILTADGYRVLDARTTAEGAKRAKTYRPAVQLLVTNLSAEGEKLARTLQKQDPNLRVLNACNHNGQRALAWLPADHQTSLPKPFALSELLKAARRLLDA
ncbi:MAG: PAS domain S-box protein [Cephaloticoccus sp.]|nr:PAS domain S-box protein [Akkermansiaceae bacterium]MCF7761350.1 PAS domain S-box protein [Cephaloticoccus sp.]